MNHFSRFSIDPNKETDNYSVTFMSARRPFRGLREELRIAVEQKANSTNRPICAMMSGGVDSQSLLITLRDMKIPFKAVHLAARYKGEYIAKRDIEQTQIFASRYNFDVEIQDIDVELNRFPYMPSMNIIRYRAPYLTTHSLVGLGGNNFHYNHNGINYYDARSYIHNETPYWILDGTEYDIDMGFYQYTPEMYFSFLFHTKTQRNLAFLKDNPHLPQSSSRLLKFNILYDEYGDELIYFQKRSGMEDYPKDVEDYDSEIWRVTGYDTWVTFTEKELRSLCLGEVPSVTKTSTVNPLILKNLAPSMDLLRK